MDVTPLIPVGRQIIEAYGDGGFRVAGIVLRGSILVFPDRALPWPVVSASTLSIESLVEVERAGRGVTVSVLLLGCGSRMTVVPGDLRRSLRAVGVVVEAMDTGAACRTYNVLMAEGRRIAAALVAVP